VGEFVQERRMQYTRQHPSAALGLARRGAASPAHKPTLLHHNQALEAELTTLRSERDTLARAVAEAAQVQRKLSAPRHFRHADFDIAGEIFPVHQVSGDLLASFEVGNQMLLAIGDIAGKSFFAGMWFAHMMGLIRLFAGSLADPALIAAEMNRQLSTLQPEPPMTTLFLAILDATTGELTYCNAGHPAPLVLRRDGSTEWLQNGGPLLGAVPGIPFANGRVVLSHSDTLVGYSDGIVECRNADGENFDQPQLVAAVRKSAGSESTARSADSILFSVLGAAQDFAGGHPCADDITLMVVHRLEETGTLSVG